LIRQRPGRRRSIRHHRPRRPPLIIERATPGIEIELTGGGRRLRFDRDADPDMVRASVARRVRQ
jgi:hypothetical protein